MSRQQDSGLAIILLAGIFLAIWLYNLIGPWGCAAVVAVIGVGVMQWRHQGKRKWFLSFNELLLAMLHEPQHWKDEKQAVQVVASTDILASNLLRDVQLIRSSLYLALSSKKRDIAEPNMAHAKVLVARIESDYLMYLLPETWLAIREKVASADHAFGTALYINMASAFSGKTKTLKTIKSKHKYLSLAADTLRDGMRDSRADKIALENALKLIERDLNQLMTAPE